MSATSSPNADLDAAIQLVERLLRLHGGFEIEDRRLKERTADCLAEALVTVSYPTGCLTYQANNTAGLLHWVDNPADLRTILKPLSSKQRALSLSYSTRISPNTSPFSNIVLKNNAAFLSAALDGLEPEDKIAVLLSEKPLGREIEEVLSRGSLLPIALEGLSSTDKEKLFSAPIAHGHVIHRVIHMQHQPELLRIALSGQPPESIERLLNLQASNGILARDMLTPKQQRIIQELKGPGPGAGSQPALTAAA